MTELLKICRACAHWRPRTGAAFVGLCTVRKSHSHEVETCDNWADLPVCSECGHKSGEAILTELAQLREREAFLETALANTLAVASARRDAVASAEQRAKNAEYKIISLEGKIAALKRGEVE